MAETSPQRAYKAACPGCGAPVEFRSAASTHAVCPYCSSTVVRSGEQLQRIGKMAELFDDFSPLQLLATGAYENRAFTVVGRLQYAYPGGSWNEWHCAFDGESQFENQVGASTGWLSEDNGRYVFLREVAAPAALPDASFLRVGMSTAIGGIGYQVTSVQSVHLSGAQGELPKMPPLSKPFTTVELRNESGAILSLDYGTDGPPRVYKGLGVQLAGLGLQGLRADTDKNEKTARQFACPNCGAPVQLRLDTSKAITCGSCNSVLDTSGGPGQEALSALQDEPIQPFVPLGSRGKLQGTDWQVVGFQHRMGHEAGDDESFGWEEYVLYNRLDGFAFLVHSSEGWSLVRPTSGAPSYKPGAAAAKYLGRSYNLTSSYDAETTYVAGEFYWAVRRGTRTANSDFASGKQLLSREQAVGTEQSSAGGEITWSRGEAMDASMVLQAFKLQGAGTGYGQSDVSPLGGSGLQLKTWLILLVLVLVAISLVSMCSSRCDPQRENCNTSGSSTYRGGTSGGSYGGWSGGGGGGHK